MSCRLQAPSSMVFIPITGQVSWRRRPDPGHLPLTEWQTLLFPVHFIGWKLRAPTLIRIDRIHRCSLWAGQRH